MKYLITFPNLSIGRVVLESGTLSFRALFSILQIKVCECWVKRLLSITAKMFQDEEEHGIL